MCSEQVRGGRQWNRRATEWWNCQNFSGAFPQLPGQGLSCLEPAVLVLGMVRVGVLDVVTTCIASICLITDRCLLLASAPSSTFCWFRWTLLNWGSHHQSGWIASKSQWIFSLWPMLFGYVLWHPGLSQERTWLPLREVCADLVYHFHCWTGCLDWKPINFFTVRLVRVKSFLSSISTSFHLRLHLARCRLLDRSDLTTYARASHDALTFLSGLRILTWGC